MSWRWFCILGLLLCSGRASAQPPEVTRILRSFDFEERRFGNEEELPMNWTKVEGPGLPHYVNGHLTTDRAHGGKYSFELDLNGGSLVYRYDPHQIEVRHGAHYRIQCFCQTTPLQHARARLSAYLTDADGHLLERTIVHSPLYAASSDQEPWHLLSIELSVTDPRASYLVLELGLVQPDLYAPASLGKRSLFVQDIRGSAWFDDVTVSQVPRVWLSTDHPGNIFRAGEPLQLQVTIDDRSTDDLEQRLAVSDAYGHAVYQRSGGVDLQAADSVRTGVKRLGVDLPELRPGWYQASLEMFSHGQSLGNRKLNLILLADDGAPAQPDPRFGIIATDLPFDGWGELPRILPFIAAGRVKLALWSRGGDVQQMDPVAFDRLLQDLQSRGIVPTACLTGLPPGIAAQAGGEDLDRLLEAPLSTWQPQLAYLVARHANHLDRWQLGADGSDAFVTNPKMQKVYGKVYQQFGQLMGNPDLAMPWPAWYELQGQLPATVALSVPPSVLPSQIPLYIQDLRNTERHNLSLNFEALDAEQYGRDLQIRDFAQRVIFALSAGANRIDLPLPFSVEREDDQVIHQPRELFIVLRTLTTLLSNATFQGRVPLGDGIEAFLFDRNGEGVMAVWNKGNASRVQSLALNLGDNAVRVDLFGRATPLFHSASGGDDHLPLQIGPEPFFVANVDGAQAQLRATVKFDRPLLESSFEAHHRRLQFSNRYRQPISGSLRLKGPAGWTFNPPTFQFSLNPGESFDQEVSVEFPYNSMAGNKTVDCQFTLSADKSSSFVVPLTLTLGLSDVGMQTLALRDGPDVVVQQIITNYGEHPIDYTAFAIYPGQARQERLVTGLGPGRTTLKKYRFPSVRVEAGANVRAGLKEIDGTRILNDQIEVK